MFQHDRPYYDKKISIIIPNIDRTFTIRNLPRWLEQTYQNIQIILLNPPNQDYYADVKKILDRYAQKLYYNEIPVDAKCCLLSCNFINAIKRTQSDIISISSIECMPLPYYTDILMSYIGKNDIVECNRSFSIPHEKRKELHKGGLQSTHKFNDYLLCNEMVPSLPKCSVFIPVMNREENIVASLPKWLQQTYPNTQIVIIDYSSKEPIENVVKSICQEYHKTFRYNEIDKNTDVLLLRMEEQEYFNISHAYNYAIRQIDTNVISLACADSVPWDFYVDLAMNMVDDESLIQIHWGLHTLTKKNWEKLNGHQEFIVGWGAEDDDFRIRATLMGLKAKILPPKFVYQIPQEHVVKAENRQVKSISESALTNQARFNQYIAQHGYVANYGEAIGQKKPIEYRCGNPINKSLRLWVFKSSILDKKNLPEEVKYNQDFDLFYIVSRGEIDGKKYTSGPWHHFYISDENNIEKYLAKIVI